MNPAQRAKRLQAHSLRCQGLTYRQIGERMRCAHSTAAKYVRDFEANRAEIIESLAADLLVHSVANLQHPDPDLHHQHINAARELRLLVNSLDQVEDRRQKRARRVAMEEEADALKNIQALEDLVVTMHENGIDDMTPYLTDHGALSTEHVTQPPLSPRAAEQDPAHNLLSPRAAGGATVHSAFSPRAAGEMPKAEGGPRPSQPPHPLLQRRPDPSSNNPIPTTNRPNPHKIVQNRTTPTRISRNPPRNTPNPAQTPESSSYPASSSPLPSPCLSPVAAAISAPTPPSADSSATGFALDPPRLPSTHGTRHQAQPATRP